ncbi:MAG: DsbA family oxidoreductase [Rhodobacteraceae bacterium]|nr:DsbA family oxidoreductase [Paracoccaceae bacterium]
MTKLDIISDVICPWCYIGKTKLDRALQAKPDHGLVIEWHPYMLNPDMPAEGMDRREYLELKFGGKQGATEVYSSIAKAAEDAGLEVRFDLIQRTPSTLDAHRLIHWAGLEGVQVAVVSALFHAYFRDGLDISDHGVLTDIAASCGMDRAVITKLLAQDADVEDIRKRARNAAAKGVRGVPCFIIDNHYVVQGAQPTDLWEKVIDDIAAQAGAARA